MTNENRLQSVFFGCLIACFALVSFLNCFAHAGQGEISETENRTLTDLPSLPHSLRGVGEFLLSLEAFYDDRFPLRLKMQQVRSLALYKLLHSSSSTAVVIGKKNWLYYFTENLSKNDAFNETQLKNWAQLFQNRSDLLKEKGIKYILVIVPEKASIYPEFLPRSLVKMKRASRFDEIQNYLKEHTTVASINLVPEFMTQKKGHQMFYKTDSHWTDYGASIAAQVLANKMSTFSAEKSTKNSNSICYEQKYFSGDLAKMLNLQGLISESVPTIKHNQFSAKEISGRSQVFVSSKIKSVNETLSASTSSPKLFVLHDSFTLALQPFLSELSSRAKFFWYQTLPYSMIAEYKPDFVIQELAERNLYTMGQLDDYNIGTYPYFKVKQNQSNSSEIKHKESRQEAAFGLEQKIEDLEVTTNGKSADLKIDWHTTSGGTLNKIIGVHILDKNGRLLASADYPQNPSYIEFEPGSRWSDSLNIAIPENRSSELKVGVVVYQNQAQPLSVQSPESDWGNHRAIFIIPQKAPLNDSQKVKAVAY